MANLQIKGIEENLYDEIKALAASENRSISQQVLFLIKDYLVKKRHFDVVKTPAQVLLDLAGSWEDDRDAKKIITDLKKLRKNSKKLTKGF